MSTQKGRLFELARAYQRYQRENVRKKKPAAKREAVQAKGEHFDEGKAISLSYNLDMYPEVLHDSHVRQTPAVQMSFFNDTSEAFYVEPFDVEEIPFRETSDEDDGLEKIARGFGSESEMEAMKEDEEKIREMEEKLDDVFKSDDDSSAMQVSDPPKSKETDADIDVPASAAVKIEGAPDNRAKEVKPYDASDEEFASDIGAILQGQKVYDAEQKKAVGKAGASAPSVRDSNVPAKSSAEKDDILDPARNEHKIFEKIAQSMTYANSYDLGSIALNEKFELMDKEIEKEEIDQIVREEKSDDIGKRTTPKAEQVPQDDSTSAALASMGIEKYNPDAPLDNNNGGRLIKENLLAQGDLVLASSSGAFDVIDGVTGSESIAGVYLGNGKLLTKSAGGALEEKPLAPHVANKGVMVVLRHPNMSAEKSSSITEGLTRLRVGPEKNQPENWLAISCSTLTLHADVCDSNEAGDKKKCNAYAGKINLGTVSNDSFMCAESIINAFEKKQLGFVTLLSKEHNGNLQYFGHLKNKA